jgi:hypothetical protein
MQILGVRSGFCYLLKASINFALARACVGMKLNSDDNLYRIISCLRRVGQSVRTVVFRSGGTNLQPPKFKPFQILHKSGF